jgi:hypothetical protein
MPVCYQSNLPKSGEAGEKNLFSKLANSRFFGKLRTIQGKQTAISE